jgi:hypothetical protein
VIGVIGVEGVTGVAGVFGVARGVFDDAKDNRDLDVDLVAAEDEEVEAAVVAAGVWKGIEQILNDTKIRKLIAFKYKPATQLCLIYWCASE